MLDVAREELGDVSGARIQVTVRDDTDYVVFSATLDYSTRCH